MADENQSGFLQSIKGKIIIASVLGCFALLLAWGISKIAFKQMLNAVENISAPNDKLRLVNELSHKITRLDQLQKSQILHDPARYYDFFRQSKKLRLTIDTLKHLYTGNKVQLRRINSLKRLLTERDKLFINYLKGREGLVNNKAFTSQVNLLNELLKKSTEQNDSTVTTTEKKTSTTTVYQSDTKEEAPRGFFNKLFGKKKPAVQNKPYQIVNEELNVKHDTLAKALRDSIIRGLGETMKKMEKAQLRKSELFVNREATLANANNKLIQQILTILKQVEAEVVKQIELNNEAAKNAVNTGVKRIGVIMLVFFLITIILLYFILTDIARSNRYKKALEAARDEAEYHGRAKQRFLSNMSHEIRTPLQSIIGYAELIKQQEHPDQKNIDAIYSSSGHLMQIVNEILDYNRIISGKFTFSPQVFNMIQLLDEVVSVIRLQAEKKNIVMVTDFEINAADYVEGDPFRLKQVLYNLLGNAIKFTDAGEVRLAVSNKEAGKFLSFVFSVADTGIGLSKQDIKRIFNEFEQVEKQNSNHLAGTGLGLTISKTLIENQGGRIDVKSKPGEGSTFTFNLSYEKAVKPVKSPEKQIDISPISKNNKVWIIDDDNFILELCSTIFKKNNIVHRCFNSPAKLLAAGWDNTVKYILIDIRLPGMSGTELCKLLRKKIPDDVIIYALTAQVLPDERELFLSECFDGLLMKPFKEQDLLTVFNQKTIDAGPQDIEIDISKVEKMTFGDKDQLTKILAQFTEDCINDIDELKSEIENHDHEKITLLVHRIAGRTAQIGASALAKEFRMAEIDLQGSKEISNKQAADILLITDELQRLIKQIKARYLTDEVVM